MASAEQLQPLPYHSAIADHLEKSEPDLWRWFRSDDYALKYKSTTYEDLLRTAIRLDSKGPNERRYGLAEQARDKLGLTEPVTLYQMQDTTGRPNAFLVYTPGEIVIAFDGRILELLDNDAELLDLLGHEISHFKLYVESEGRFHTADRMLLWIARRDDSPAEFIETWRRYRLYTEIYCDIGGHIACGDRDATIRGLVKSLADFKDADAESYLQQALELMSKGPGVSRGTTHPELHVRVLAVAGFDTMSADDFGKLVSGLISGRSEIGGLDLIDQALLAGLTRRVIDRVLREPSVATDAALAHARQMFSDYASPPTSTASMTDVSASLAPSAIDYLAFVLLDFGTLDDGGSRDIIAAASQTANELGIGQRFRDIARKELKGRRSLIAALASPLI